MPPKEGTELSTRIKGLSNNRGGACDSVCENESPSGLGVPTGVFAVGVVPGEMVEEDDREQPDESDEPEKETFLI